jgi:hypothetical protein
MGGPEHQHGKQHPTRMVVWGVNIQELRQAISEGKGRRRQRKASAGILVFMVTITTDGLTDKLTRSKYQ